MWKEINNRVSMHDYVIVDGKMYFSALNYNALYEYDLKSKTLKYLLSFPNERILIRHLHAGVVEKNGNIFFAPMNGHYFAIYNIKNNVIKSIPVKNTEKELKSKFYNIISNDKEIIYIPCRGRYFVILNTQTYSIKYFNGWLNRCGIVADESDMLFKNGAFIRENMIYLACLLKNYIIAISLDTYKTNVIEIGNDNIGFSDMYFDEKTHNIWLLKNKMNGLVCWEMDRNIIEEYPLPQNNIGVVEYPYLKMIILEGLIYLIAYQADYSIAFDMQKRYYFDIEWAKDLIHKNNTEWNAGYYFLKQINNRHFLISHEENYEFSIVGKDGILKKMFLQDEKKQERIKDLQRLRIAQAEISKKENTIKNNIVTKIHQKSFCILEARSCN